MFRRHIRGGFRSDDRGCLACLVLLGRDDQLSGRRGQGVLHGRGPAWNERGLLVQGTTKESNILAFVHYFPEWYGYKNTFKNTISSWENRKKTASNLIDNVDRGWHNRDGDGPAGCALARQPSKARTAGAVRTHDHGVTLWGKLTSISTATWISISMSLLLIITMIDKQQ